MTDQELLRAIEHMLEQKLEQILEQKLEQILEQKLDEKFDQKLTPVYQRLDKLEEDMTGVKDGLSEVRTGVNTLLEWAEETGEAITFPLPKMKL